MKKEEMKIVSGGQTGVDQGALDAAMNLGLDWGGWAPKGWLAENGTIAERYRANMREGTSANYLVRTKRNVVDSDATLIIVQKYPLSGGTLKTRVFCEKLLRSHFVVSLDERDAVEKARAWLRQFLNGEPGRPFVLNVAGPRESKAAGIQSQTAAFVSKVYEGV